MSSKNKLLSFVLIVIAGSAISSLDSCYYDNEEYLYSGTGNCDTIFTYSGRIKTITDNNCAMSGCHTATNPAGSIPLTTYQEVRAGIEVVGMLCSIRHQSGCSPMPKNRAQLNACDIQAYEKWRDLGFPQ